MVSKKVVAGLKEESSESVALCAECLDEMVDHVDALVKDHKSHWISIGEAVVAQEVDNLKKRAAGRTDGASWKNGILEDIDWSELQPLSSDTLLAVDKNALLSAIKSAVTDFGRVIACSCAHTIQDPRVSMSSIAYLV